MDDIVKHLESAISALKYDLPCSALICINNAQYELAERIKQRRQDEVRAVHEAAVRDLEATGFRRVV